MVDSPRNLPAYRNEKLMVQILREQVLRPGGDGLGHDLRLVGTEMPIYLTNNGKPARADMVFIDGERHLVVVEVKVVLDPKLLLQGLTYAWVLAQPEERAKWERVLRREGILATGEALHPKPRLWLVNWGLPREWRALLADIDRAKAFSAWLQEVRYYSLLDGGADRPEMNQVFPPGASGKSDEALEGALLGFETVKEDAIEARCRRVRG